MKYDDVMASCKKCRQKAPASQMRMDLDEKMMICPNCMKAKRSSHASAKTQATRQPVSVTVESIPTRQQEAPQKSSKVSKACYKCGYVFKFNLDTGTPKTCPYCSADVRG